MKIKNIVILIVGIIAYLNCISPIATLYAMNKHKHMKELTPDEKREFFTYLKKIPLELQQKVEDSMAKDALMFLSFLPITVLSEEEYAGVTCLAMTDTLLINGAYDMTAKIWDIYSGELLNTLEGHDRTVLSVAIHDGKVVTGSEDYTAKIWNIDTGEELYTLEGHTAEIYSVAINGNHIITASADGIIKIWNAKTYQLLHTLNTEKFIYSVAIGNNKLVAGLDDNTAMLWDIDTKQLLHTFKDHTENVIDVIMIDNKVITGSKDGIVKIWDINTYRLLHTIESFSYYEELKVIAAIKDNLITGSPNGIVKVWGLNTYRLLRTPVEGDIGRVNSIAANGNLFAIGSDDGIVGVWLLEPFEGTPGNNPTIWIMKHANMQQLHFISRAYRATKAHYDLIIDLPEKLNVIKEDESQAQREGRIYFSFPPAVRQLLRNNLNIRKKEYNF